MGAGGKPDFSQLSFTADNSKFAYGHFINDLISFLIVAAVVYFFVVLPVGDALAAPAEPSATGAGDRRMSGVPEIHPPWSS